jgi:hypothetical protein
MSRNLKALCLGPFAAFALSAIAAMGAEADFKAGAANTVIHAVQDPDEPVQRLQTPIGTTTCEEVSGTAALAAQSPELTGEGIEFQKCHMTALKIPVTIDMNGCHFKFTAGTTTPGGPGFSSGSVHIEGCEEAKGITITVFNSMTEHNEAHRTCVMHWPEQTISPTIYQNRQTAGKKEEITIEANKAKVKTTTTQSTVGTLCSGATHEFEAEYTGRLTASGTVEGVPVDATLVST